MPSRLINAQRRLARALGSSDEDQAECVAEMLARSGKLPPTYADADATAD
jgi:hypothetical protein